MQKTSKSAHYFNNILWMLGVSPAKMVDFEIASGRAGGVRSAPSGGKLRRKLYKAFFNNHVEGIGEDLKKRYFN